VQSRWLRAKCTFTRSDFWKNDNNGHAMRTPRHEARGERKTTVWFEVSLQLPALEYMVLCCKLSICASCNNWNWLFGPFYATFSIYMSMYVVLKQAAKVATSRIFNARLYINILRCYRTVELKFVLCCGFCMCCFYVCCFCECLCLAGFSVVYNLVTPNIGPLFL